MHDGSMDWWIRIHIDRRDETREKTGQEVETKKGNEKLRGSKLTNEEINQEHKKSVRMALA
jgi:hypothetical protein